MISEPQPAVEATSLSPVADLGKFTGDPIEDYNRYRRTPDNKTENRLLACYSGLIQLTCSNLEMYRDSDAELLLREDPNGNLMAITALDGSFTVLLMVGLDPSASRSLLAGIFRFPSNPGAVRLAKAARAFTRNGQGNYVIRGGDRGSFESA